MSGLIDANALKDKVEEMRTAHGLCYAVRTTDILAAPTVDAVAVVHAKWVERLWRSEDDPEYDRFSTHCSRCNQQRVDGIHLANYCPNCGAKMEGGE